MSTAKITKKAKVEVALASGNALTHAALMKRSGLGRREAVAAVVSQLNQAAISANKRAPYKGFKDKNGTYKYTRT